LSSEARTLEDVQTAGKILEARQRWPVNAERERHELRRRQAERHEVTSDQLGASTQREAERWLRGREPCDVGLDGNVEAVECLENAAVPMQVEPGIHQSELGLETSMNRRGFTLQTRAE